MKKIRATIITSTLHESNDDNKAQPNQSLVLALVQSGGTQKEHGLLMVAT
jgi:hypothetical protein